MKAEDNEQELIDMEAAGANVVSLDLGDSDKKARRKKREDFGTKTEAHVRYKTKDGAIVPGSTTILGVLDKPPPRGVG